LLGESHASFLWQYMPINRLLTGFPMNDVPDFIVLQKVITLAKSAEERLKAGVVVRLRSVLVG
jgi:hypothetical protein